MTSTRDFYYEIESFRNFQDFTLDKNYHKIPSDWYIVITDVKGSTKAIESGRYRDVNILGVSTIVSVQNALGSFEFPYSFGGDGASLCIPETLIDKVSSTLIDLKSKAKANFNLELRIGKIQASELAKQNSFVEVAKYEITKGKVIALFRGGGMSVADKLIKENLEKYEIQGVGTPASFHGLSCRWNPLKSKSGRFLSLMVISRSDQKVYKEILSFLNKTLTGNLDRANPVDTKSMTYKKMIDCFKDEKRYHNSLFEKKFFNRLIDMLIAYIIFYFKVPLKSFNTKKYMDSLISHSDYRKFDDTLRMVIDCRNNDIEKIKSFLDNLYMENKIFYGVFESDEAIMTCFVPSTQDGDHIHFIDGGNGGYAMAAKQMKEQISKNA